MKWSEPCPHLRINTTTPWLGQTREPKTFGGAEDSKSGYLHTIPIRTAQQAQEGGAHAQHGSLAAGSECPCLDSGTRHQLELGSSQATLGQLHLQSLGLPPTRLGSIHRPDAQAGSPPHTRQETA